ncbi:unnamed protein product [Sphagnum jensenii]
MRAATRQSDINSKEGEASCVGEGVVTRGVQSWRQGYTLEWLKTVIRDVNSSTLVRISKRYYDPSIDLQAPHLNLVQLAEYSEIGSVVPTNLQFHSKATNVMSIQRDCSSQILGKTSSA